MTRIHEPSPRRRLRGDQGAALPEFALVLPVLAVLVMGILEFGYAWRNATALERTATSAGRAAATLGTNWRTDYEVLRSVNAGLAGTSGASIERVIVYRSDTSDGAVPAECLAIEPPHESLSVHGVNGVCNVYSRAQVQTDSLSGFGRVGTVPDLDCAGGSWHSPWCPMDRERRRPPQATPEHVGVYIEVSQPTMTGMFTDEFDFEREAVFLLEPPSLGDDY